MPNRILNSAINRIKKSGTCLVYYKHSPLASLAQGREPVQREPLQVVYGHAGRARKGIWAGASADLQQHERLIRTVRAELDARLRHQD